MGGLERHARSLTAQQASEGLEVELFTMLGNPQFESNRVVVHRVPGAWLARLMPRDTLLSALFLVLCLPFVVVAHRRRPFDVFHLHGDVFEAIFGAMLTALTGRPAVVTIHAGLNRRRIYRLVARYFFRRVSGLLAHSQEIREELVSLGVDDERISLSHSGIWLSSVANPAENEKPAVPVNIGEERASGKTDPLLAVCVGRIHPMKGHRHLIEAVRLFQNEARVQVHIVGDGSELESLKKAAQGMDDLIKFRGELNHEQVVELLHSADIFVLPSVSLPRQRESTPTALLEAMACGLPIVTTACGGIKDIVDDLVNGLIVPEADPQALADALQMLASNAGARADMRKANLHKASQFDWPVISAGISNAYRVAAGI